MEAWLRVKHGEAAGIDPNEDQMDQQRRPNPRGTCVFDFTTEILLDQLISLPTCCQVGLQEQLSL